MATVEGKRQAPAEAVSQSPDFRCGSHVAEPPETTPQQQVALVGKPLARKKMKVAARKIQLNSPWAQNDLFSHS
ncbi:hypothetical protein [Hydrogenophaga sp.]|uniref:hypothetical protein n=1 Tax=Hydrogenophaga sp. TaxID=1904254 RepID=UPI00272974F4|nr:hypothetical protein [Hydrogenophaga sp.]